MSGQGFVRTVLGDVAPETLGLTLCHEHLVTAPAPRLRDGDDLLLDDPAKAVAELEVFRQAGGGALIELTVAEFGRDVRALRAISAQSGVQVVATTGHVSVDYWDGVIDVPALSVEQLVEEMTADLSVGVDGSEVRAGIIKAGSSRDEVTDAEERVLTAAGITQRRTGSPITTHTTAGTMAPDQARILLAAGADPRRVCLGHLDRRLRYPELRALAREGFLLGFDCISKDWYEPDAKRVETVARLVDDGLVEHVVLSGDLARRSSWVSWGGGPGYSYIPWRFVPWLRRQGLEEQAIRQITVGNPARLLTWATPS
ncbi:MULTISPECIES: phosphotriesterase family protein [unclassified Nocardioides]|uniref:phosphotriesterase family protein n=1 Tax=unclassified Nocardioides TaxID=2615069 RepID=UPI0009F05F91|nr:MULTISPECIES: phosphotriesterase [unclassified Nocardioides]GAW48719.1 Putative phosphotriesterase [Nocardioides sp. PD653-B2]GAW54356.1 putative phosphotriesterase [Nocardioides sp. PD653]